MPYRALWKIEFTIDKLVLNIYFKLIENILMAAVMWINNNN